MAIVGEFPSPFREAQTDNRNAASAQRTKVPGVDHAVLQHNTISANGQDFRSSTYTTKMPSAPSILETARHHQSGLQTMVALNVEPTDSPLSAVDNIPLYDVSVQYFNKTNRSYKVIDRHNVGITLPKTSQWNETRTEHLLIRKIHRFNQANVALSVLQNHQGDSNVLSIEDNERQQIIDRISDHHRIGGFRGAFSVIEITVDRLLPVSMLKNYASLYISDLDLLITEEGASLGTPHPSSQDAQLHGAVLSLAHQRRMSGYLFDIVDNENTYNPRYIQIGNEIVKVPSARDPNYSTGIYCTRIDSTDPYSIRVQMEEHPLDKGEELGFFRTKEEAESHGNTDKVAETRLHDTKIRLREQEMENEMLKARIQERELERGERVKTVQHDRDLEKARLEIERLSQERNNLFYQQEQIQLKHELEINQLNEKHRASLRELGSKCLKAEHELELEKQKNELRQESMQAEERHKRRSMHRDDYYEERSHARKDTSELVKWAPAIVTGVVGVAAVVAMQQRQRNGSYYSDAELAVIEQGILSSM